MMSLNCESLIDAYLQWLRQRISIEEVNGKYEITTPFLDRHNDRLQIYVASGNESLRITDDGYTISDLESSGCLVKTPSRQQALKTILGGFGVNEEQGELFVEANPGNFPQRKHALVQAMLAVNDMFLVNKPHVATLFMDDVVRFLDGHDVRYSPRVSFTGKSGFIHRFEFVIPKSKKAPERLIRAINHANRQNVTSTLFAWTDTREARDPKSQFIVILNDTEQKPSPEFSSAFQGYRATVIPWSRREEFAPQLAT